MFTNDDTYLPLCGSNTCISCMDFPSGVGREVTGFSRSLKATGMEGDTLPLPRGPNDQSYQTSSLRDKKMWIITNKKNLCVQHWSIISNISELNCSSESVCHNEQEKVISQCELNFEQYSASNDKLHLLSRVYPHQNDAASYRPIKHFLSMLKILLVNMHNNYSKLAWGPREPWWAIETFHVLFVTLRESSIPVNALRVAFSLDPITRKTTEI